MVHGNAWNTLQHALAGSQAAERAGDLRAYLFVKPFTALALADMGDVARSRENPARLSDAGTRAPPAPTRLTHLGELSCHAPKARQRKLLR